MPGLTALGRSRYVPSAKALAPGPPTHGRPPHASQGCCFVKYGGMPAAEASIAALHNQRSLPPLRNPLQVHTRRRARGGGGVLLPHWQGSCCRTAALGKAAAMETLLPWSWRARSDCAARLPGTGSAHHASPDPGHHRARCASPTLAPTAATAGRPMRRTSSSWAACRAAAARRSCGLCLARTARCRTPACRTRLCIDVEAFRAFIFTCFTA